MRMQTSIRLYILPKISFAVNAFLLKNGLNKVKKNLKSLIYGIFSPNLCCLHNLVVFVQGLRKYIKAALEKKIDMYYNIQV